MNAIKRFFLNDTNILVLILINAIIIFLQGFRPSEINQEYLHLCLLVDDVLSIIFMIEVIVKSRHYGWKPYIQSGWNKLDVFLVALSVPPLMLYFFAVSNVQVGFLLIFRVFRVFKFFRFVKFFPDMDHIIRSVRLAINASFSVLAGFILLVFIISIMSCYFYQNLAPQYFGNPILSFYSIFKVFTVEGWNTIPDDICKNPSVSYTTAFFTKTYFVVILFLGGIYGLSIVNSIFVDAMVSDNNEELEAHVNKIEHEMENLNKKLDQIVSLIEKQKNE